MANSIWGRLSIAVLGLLKIPSYTRNVVFRRYQYRMQISAQGRRFGNSAGDGHAGESDYPSTRKAIYGRWQLPHRLLFLAPAH
jgi:hypothetical protein